MPDQPLKLKVASSYLYGAPADGNRFTAKLLVAPEVHPLETLKDTFFGNPLVDLPKSADDVVDARLDAQGELEQDVALPDDVKPVAPLAVTLSGSVYESGGRAVTRLLKRVYWPAPQLVGVRPLFDPEQGAESEGTARFEILRADVDGKLVAGHHLKVRLQRELRDFYWLYEHGDGWKSDANQHLQLVEEKDVDVDAGQRVQVDFPVQWGGYRLEVYDPDTTAHHRVSVLRRLQLGRREPGQGSAPGQGEAAAGQGALPRRRHHEGHRHPAASRSRRAAGGVRPPALHQEHRRQGRRYVRHPGDQGLGAARCLCGGDGVPRWRGGRAQHAGPRDGHRARHDGSQRPAHSAAP